MVSGEQTPLLSSKSTTPLPWGQFSIVMIMQLAEPVTSFVIYPFAPDLIRRLGIPEQSVGHYVGILQSLFFLTQGTTVLQWSRLSDVIGRKPVILTGLCGLALSMYCFGLSTTFWGLVFSRCLNGALNGNIGVMKSIIAELTDSTNVAQAVAWLPLSWNLGCMIGPIIGGFLSHPADRWPHIFGHHIFLHEYPYFLACAVPATFSLLIFFITLFKFQETLPHATPVLGFFGFRTHERKDQGELAASSALENGVTSPGGPCPQAKSSSKPLPLKKLLTRRVVLAGSAYAFLSLADICFLAIQPTFLSTPVSYGGLGWSPSDIGRLLSVRAVLNGLFQAGCFARLIRRYGPKVIFITAATSFAPLFALFWCINRSALLAISQGPGSPWSIAARALLSIQVLGSLLGSMGFGSVIMYINSSAPNSRSIGATNGVCQMTVSIMRAIGPSLANSLFSITLKRHYVGGGLVYLVLLCTSLIATWIGTFLPAQLWDLEDSCENDE